MQVLNIYEKMYVPTLGSLEDLGLIVIALQEELVVTPPPGVLYHC